MPSSPETALPETVLEVRDLKVHFPVMAGAVVRKQVGRVKAGDGVVGGAPRDPEALGDAAHRQVPDHDRLQRPPQPATRQLGPWLGGTVGVLAPHVPASGAAVAAHGDAKRGGSPPERLMGQLADHGVARRPLPAAAAAPPLK